MLLRLGLRDVVIVRELEVDFSAGFTVLSGETGAGKSILIDALQLALGGRADAGVVRDGAARAEILAEFTSIPDLSTWLDAAGFPEGETLLLRRSVDSQGRSRAWINGGGATVAQLRELGERLVDIHGQHAWQGLTRPEEVRGLLDAYAGAREAAIEVARVHARWRQAQQTLDEARARQGSLERERERLQWQIAEWDKLAPADGEWSELNADHGRLAHAQAIQDAIAQALDGLRDGEAAADTQVSRAVDALESVSRHDASLEGVIEVLRQAQAGLQDAAHSLTHVLRQAELDPTRLATLDERLALWIGLARRWRCPPEDLPALGAAWRRELQTLDAASDLEGLQADVDAAAEDLGQAARALSRLRRAAAPRLSAAITASMQNLGMQGGVFEVVLEAVQPLTAHGGEQVEFHVAGHAGSRPRPLGKVASGGELSRIALAIAVCTSRLGTAGTLIFDEIDAGIGGAVAETVGRLMRQLGRDRQVLAITHLPQVAACGDQHLVVRKQAVGEATVSDVHAVQGEDRIREVARMLGGSALSGAGWAHAKEMLEQPPSTPEAEAAPTAQRRASAGRPRSPRGASS